MLHRYSWLFCLMEYEIFHGCFFLGSRNLPPFFGATLGNCFSPKPRRKKTDPTVWNLKVPNMDHLQVAPFFLIFTAHWYTCCVGAMCWNLFSSFETESVNFGPHGKQPLFSFNRLPRWLMPVKMYQCTNDVPWRELFELCSNPLRVWIRRLFYPFLKTGMDRETEVDLIHMNYHATDYQNCTSLHLIWLSTDMTIW